MDGSLLNEKSLFQMLEVSLFSELDWDFQSFSIAKSASKKIRALIHFLKFLSSEVALYHYKSTIWSCMSVDPPSCYLDMLDKLQKTVCSIVGP